MPHQQALSAQLRFPQHIQIFVYHRFTRCPALREKSSRNAFSLERQLPKPPTSLPQQLPSTSLQYSCNTPVILNQRPYTGPGRFAGPAFGQVLSQALKYALRALKHSSVFVSNTLRRGGWLAGSSLSPTLFLTQPAGNTATVRGSVDDL